MSVAELSNVLGERFPQVSPRSNGDCPAFDVPTDQLLEVLTFLRDEAGCDLLLDVTGVDWGVDAEPRFGVFYHLMATATHEYLRIHALCSAEEPPKIASACDLWPAANWHEREAFDFFGIQFEGHPDLRRILMWDGYPHHPMRKDFPLAGVETVLPDEEVAEETGTPVLPAPMAGGPFVAPQKDTVRTREPRARDESWNEKAPKPAD